MDMAMVGSHRSIGIVTTGLEPVVDGFPVSPYAIQIPHLRCQAILLDHLNGIDKLWSSEEPPLICLPPISRGTMPPEDAVDGSTRQTHATSNSILPSRASTNTSCLMHIGADGELLEQPVRNEKKNAIVDLNLPTKLRFWTSMIPLGTEEKVQPRWRFRWGAVTSTFHINFSPLEAQKMR